MEMHKSEFLKHEILVITERKKKLDAERNGNVCNCSWLLDISTSL